MIGCLAYLASMVHAQQKIQMEKTVIHLVSFTPRLLCGLIGHSASMSVYAPLTMQTLTAMK